jgi:ribonuclease R
VGEPDPGLGPGDGRRVKGRNPDQGVRRLTEARPARATGVTPLSRFAGKATANESGWCGTPIRRYPDLVCHRALLRELGVSDEPVAEDLAALADHSSAREREATEVEYAADAICLAWLLERRLFEQGWEHPFDGEITGAIPSGIFVRFAEVFEGYVPARSLGGDYYELNAFGTALEGRRSGRAYRLGAQLAVRVEKIDRAAGKVELRVASSLAA